MIKSLIKDGGQNPIEPARLGCKILHGPYVSNFEETYNYLRTLEITKLVKNSNELSISLLEEFNNDKPKIRCFLSNELVLKVIQILHQLVKFDVPAILDRTSIYHEILPAMFHFLEFDKDQPGYSYGIQITRSKSPILG